MIEGIDGSGKDSQADLLVKALREEGYDPVRVNEPYEAHPHGKLLRELLKSGAFRKSHAALFLADRLALQEEVILPALETDRPVVCVRSFLSTLVYQQAHWPLEWLVDIHREMLCTPSVLVYLDVPVEVGLSRVGRRGTDLEFYEKEDVLQRNRKRYLQLMGEQEPVDSIIGGPHTRLILDATRSREEVASDIWNVVGYTLDIDTQEVWGSGNPALKEAAAEASKNAYMPDVRVSLK